MSIRVLLTAALSIACLVGFAKSPQAASSKPLPAATFDSVAYGTHPRQKIDVWLPANAAKPTPVVVFVHGGGFTKGDRKDKRLAVRVPKCLASGVALVSIGYRFLQDVDGVKPPVKACLDDVMAALNLIRSKAHEWNIDTGRIGLTGGSAGGCACLLAALSNDNALGIRVVYAEYSQTTLDPKEMKEWIPNSRYGAKLFGYSDFQTWLEHRDEVLPWIERFSASTLLRRCTPAKAPLLLFSGPKAPPPGKLDKDPTHSGIFNVKLAEIAKGRGVTCRRGNEKDFLAVLKASR